MLKLASAVTTIITLYSSSSRQCLFLIHFFRSIFIKMFILKTICYNIGFWTFKPKVILAQVMAQIKMLRRERRNKILIEELTNIPCWMSKGMCRHVWSWVALFHHSGRAQRTFSPAWLWSPKAWSWRESMVPTIKKKSLMLYTKLI